MLLSQPLLTHSCWYLGPGCQTSLAQIPSTFWLISLHSCSAKQFYLKKNFSFFLNIFFSFANYLLLYSILCPHDNQLLLVPGHYERLTSLGRCWSSSTRKCPPFCDAHTKGLLSWSLAHLPLTCPLTWGERRGGTSQRSIMGGQSWVSCLRASQMLATATVLQSFTHSILPLLECLSFPLLPFSSFLGSIFLFFGCHQNTVFILGATYLYFANKLFFFFAKTVVVIHRITCMLWPLSFLILSYHYVLKIFRCHSVPWAHELSFSSSVIFFFGSLFFGYGPRCAAPSCRWYFRVQS